MNNAEVIVTELAKLQQSISYLTTKITAIEEKIYNMELDRSLLMITSEPFYLNQEPQHSNFVDGELEEYYYLRSYHLNGMEIVGLERRDLKKFITEVTRLKKHMAALGDLEMIKGSIYRMAAEADQMQTDMIKIINEEGNKTINKMRDLASRTSTTRIDNKDLILEKDNDENESE